MLESLKDRFRKKKRWLHANIAHLLSKTSLDVNSLSIETGVPVATIFRMKKEDNNPTLSSLEPIADFFEIDLNDFLYEDITSEEYRAKHPSKTKIKYVPVITLTELKKWPIDLNTKLYIGTNGNVDDESFGITIDTNSFIPIFYESSVIIIDPSIEPKDGDYILCLLNDDAIPVLRQVFIDGIRFYFKSINPNLTDMTYVDGYKIIGVVVRSIENFR